MRKQSKQKISVIQRDIWKECRRIAFLQQKDKNGKITCYTCPATGLEGSNCQLGHVPYPKSTLGALLKYDLRLLKFQCMRCNQFMGGMGAEAYKRMLKENGQEYMDKIDKERQVTIKAHDHYLQLLEEYKKLCTE